MGGLGDKWNIYKASWTLVTVNGNTTNSKSDPHKSKPSEREHLAKQTHKPVGILLVSDFIGLPRVKSNIQKPFLQLYPLSKTLIPDLSGSWPFKAKQCLLTTSRHRVRNVCSNFTRVMLDFFFRCITLTLTHFLSSPHRRLCNKRPQMHPKTKLYWNICLEICCFGCPKSSSGREPLVWRIKSGLWSNFVKSEERWCWMLRFSILIILWSQIPRFNSSKMYAC